MDTDGFAWLDSAEKNNVVESQPTEPDKVATGPEKKPSRFPHVLVTIFLILVIVGAVIAAIPTQTSTQTYSLSFSQQKPTLLLLSGQVDVTGTLEAISIENGTSQFFGIERLLVTGEMGTQVFNNTDLQIEEGQFIWWVTTPLEITETSGFIMVTDTFEEEKRTSITFFTNDPLDFEGHTSFLTTQNSTVRIDNQVFTEDLVIQLEGDFPTVHLGETIRFAITDTANIQIEKSGSPLLFEDLLENVIGAEDDIDLNVPHLPFDANGIAISMDINVTVDGSTLNYSYFCYSQGTYLVTVGDTISLDGICTLILTDKGFYVEEEGYDLVPFIPKKLIGFWPIAFGIWSITRFFLPKKKRFTRPYENTEKKSLKYWALFLHILFFLIAFYLWDREINNILGNSLLSLIYHEGVALFTLSSYNPLIIMIPFELISWFVAFLFIGLPLSISINSLLDIWWLYPYGKGIGKGLGNLTIWLLGSVYILFFLNILISPLLNAVIQQIG